MNLNKHGYVNKKIENVWNQYPSNFNELTWDLIHESEDISGSLMITAGVMCVIASGPMLLPIVMISTGVGLCYLATGMDDVTDLGNPYYHLAAAPSILMSLNPLGTESKLAYLTGSTLIKESLVSSSKVVVKNNLKILPSWITTPAYNIIDGSLYNGFLESCGYHPS